MAKLYLAAGTVSFAPGLSSLLVSPPMFSNEVRAVTGFHRSESRVDMATMANMPNERSGVRPDGPNCAMPVASCCVTGF